MKYAPASTFILAAFFLLSFSVLYFAIAADIKEDKAIHLKNRQQEEDRSLLYNVNYYFHDGVNPQLYLNAKVLDLDNISGSAFFEFPQGLAYTPKKEVVHYKANWGHYDKILQHLILKEKVYLQDETSQIRSRFARYQIDKEEFWGDGNVQSETFAKNTNDKIFINSDHVYSRPMHEYIEYRGQVDGKIERKRKYEEGIYFWSQYLTLNGKSSHIFLKDKVKIKRGGVLATSHKGEIFLENYNKKLKYYTLYDDVKLVEEITLITGGKTERRAFAERLDGYTRPGQVVLTGYPKVIQENDVLKGNKMTLFENKEVIEVDDSHSTFTIKKQAKEMSP